MWTAAALRRNRTRLAGRLWRAVEAQHRNSTRRIVETADEQARLEVLLEGTKPAYPAGSERLDYLLASPFRYGNPQGSRFRRAGLRWGIFYASETVRVALAEIAYHRMRFFLASEGTPLPRQTATLTVFSVHYDTAEGLDLCRPPFDGEQTRWSDPNDYTATQKLGERAVEAGIAALRYTSARAPEPGHCVAVLDWRAFSITHPETRQTWHLYLGAREATASRAMAEKHEHHAFARFIWSL